MTLRPETADDASFLRALFTSHAVAMLAPARLPPGQAEALAEMQHRSQVATYAARHPQARRWIAHADGERAGRLVEADAQGGVCIVDLAVTEAWLRCGIGSALVRDVVARARARGRGVRAEVAPDNAASLALFRRCGFDLGSGHDTGRLDVTLDARDASDAHSLSGQVRGV